MPPKNPPRAVTRGHIAQPLVDFAGRSAGARTDIRRTQFCDVYRPVLPANTLYGVGCPRVKNKVLFASGPILCSRVTGLSATAYGLCDLFRDPSAPAMRAGVAVRASVGVARSPALGAPTRVPTIFAVMVAGFGPQRPTFVSFDICDRGLRFLPMQCSCCRMPDVDNPVRA